MKKIILILFLSAWAHFAIAQGFRTLSVDPGDYEILHEDSTVSVKGELLKVASDLTEVTNNPVHPAIHEMKFTRAILKGDTLTISIFETHPALRHEYTIKIVKKKYMIDYQVFPNGESTRKIKTEGFGLILNSADFGKGKELRGYTEYRGNCVKGCSKDRPVIIRGNFKVTVE